jgi:hypothetical protein
MASRATALTSTWDTIPLALFRTMTGTDELPALGVLTSGTAMSREVKR